jgi:hypothetical protein
MIEAIALGIISTALYYTVSKIDGLDRRIDRLCLQLERLELSIPKRSTDKERDFTKPYYSPNSGIEL